MSRLSVAELDQYEAILNRETIDIFNYITEKDPTPPEIDGTIMTELKEYCATSPLGKASPAAYEEGEGEEQSDVGRVLSRLRLYRINTWSGSVSRCERSVH